MTSVDTSDFSTQLAALMREESALADRARTAVTREDKRAIYVRQRGLYARHRDLTCAAAEAFARLNGWRFIIDKTFSASTLARGGVHDGGVYRMYDVNLFDHPLYFRERVRPYRAATIVGQPYGFTPEEARAAAAKIGLACHIPPNYLASWHCPGHQPSVPARRKRGSGRVQS